jgi:lipopolysaccharide biosynthesis glycosyltransferase
MAIATAASEPIRIACGIDANYLAPLAVTLYSMASNLHDEATVEVHILLSGGQIRSKVRKRLERVLRSAHRRITLHWHQPDVSAIVRLRTQRWMTSAAYVRLLIPAVLPESTHRVIYLDSDLVVEADLGELWSLDMAQHAVLAVQNYGASYVSYPLGIARYEELGLDAKAPYFNSGVMLIDVRNWRETGITERAIDYLRRYERQLNTHDQEGLNAVLSGKWRAIDPRWNQMTNILWFEQWPESQFKEEIRGRYRLIMHEPFIIHFSGPSKPWRHDCLHPLQPRYLHYLERSGWYGPAAFGWWKARFMWRRIRWMQELRTKREAEAGLALSQ